MSMNLASPFGKKYWLIVKFEMKMSKKLSENSEDEYLDHNKAKSGLK